MKTLFSRRTVLHTGSAVLAAPYLWLPAQAETSLPSTMTVGPSVETEIANGRIRGGHSRGALAFKAIPYAGPVSGRNRFKAPPPVESWTGVRDCTKLGPPAMQGPGTTYGENEPPYSEECLVLNVWTPAVNDNRRRPVMFYCHGGGYTTGSGGQNIQDGSHLAATYDVVVVASNHRLGLLGYLYLGEIGGEEYATSGNQGMLDIVAALKWVKENIAVFGGDPGNVMVFGESGGGYKTGTLMAMPAAKGLFHKAGIQSGAGLRRLTADDAAETAVRVLAGLDIAPSDFRKLHDVPAGKFVAMQMAAEKGGGPLSVPTKAYLARHGGKDVSILNEDRAGQFGPVVEGHVLPQHPFDPAASPLGADIPLLLGNMRDEAIFFLRDTPAAFRMTQDGLEARAKQVFGDRADLVLSTYRRTRPQATPTELLIAIQTAVTFGNDTVTAADRKSVQPAPVYRYRYDYESNTPIKGTNWTLRAAHACDIAPVFYNYDIRDLSGIGPGLAEVSRAMSAFFANFARSGVPSAPGQPAWPRYDTAHRPVMLIDSTCKTAADPDGAERAMWQNPG
jgi:para-nitrobenzyl esterase